MCQMDLSSFPREEIEVYLGAGVFYQRDSSLLKSDVSGKLFTQSRVSHENIDLRISFTL